MPQQCTFCSSQYETGADHCTACGMPAPGDGFPNVVLAERDMQALQNRYAQALEAADSKGSRATVALFEQTVTADAALVTACSLEKVSQLVERKGSLFAVYANLVRARIRFPGDDRNNTDRLVAEEATIPGNSQSIHYAALSLGGLGLSNYGNYFLFWRIDRVAHRTSLLQGNCLTFRRKQGIDLDGPLPPGSRALWDERHLLAVAKCEHLLLAATAPEEFPEILITVAATSDDDDFIEAHIWGHLSSDSLDRVVFAAPDPEPFPNEDVDRAYFAAMKDRMLRDLDALGIAYEVKA